MLKFWRLLLPRACPGCGQQLGQAVGLCEHCVAQLRPVVESHSPLSNAVYPHLISLGMYRGPVRRAVRAFKFHGARDLARPLGSALAQALPLNWEIHAVIPVPAHPRRERERGYNQAQLLAQVIAAELRVPCVSALRRTRHTAQQARKHRQERASNLQGAFALAQPVPSGPVLLVDDVLTTGATLLACRDLLLAGGAEEIRYAVIAR